MIFIIKPVITYNIYISERILKKYVKKYYQLGYIQVFYTLHHPCIGGSYTAKKHNALMKKCINDLYLTQST